MCVKQAMAIGGETMPEIRGFACILVSEERYAWQKTEEKDGTSNLRLRTTVAMQIPKANG